MSAPVRDILRHWANRALRAEAAGDLRSCRMWSDAVNATHRAITAEQRRRGR